MREPRIPLAIGPIDDGYLSCFYLSVRVMSAPWICRISWLLVSIGISSSRFVLRQNRVTIRTLHRCGVCSKDESLVRAIHSRVKTPDCDSIKLVRNGSGVVHCSSRTFVLEDAVMTMIRPRATYNPELDERKLDEVILFMLHNANNELMGRTKLMKMLYYADFDHYEQYDQKLTGARYRKLDHGPVPDDAMEALERLQAAGRVVCREEFSGTYRWQRCDAIDQVDLSVFSPTEIDTLHQVVSRWVNHTTKQIEAATHGEAPWVAAKLYDEIPYYLAHYRNNFGAMSLGEDEFAVDGDEIIAT